MDGTGEKEPGEKTGLNPGEFFFWEHECLYTFSSGKRP